MVLLHPVRPNLVCVDGVNDRAFADGIKRVSGGGGVSLPNPFIEYLFDEMTTANNADPVANTYAGYPGVIVGSGRFSVEAGGHDGEGKYLSRLDTSDGVSYVNFDDLEDTVWGTLAVWIKVKRPADADRVYGIASNGSGPLLTVKAGTLYGGYSLDTGVTVGTDWKHVVFAREQFGTLITDQGYDVYVDGALVYERDGADANAVIDSIDFVGNPTNALHHFCPDYSMVQIYADILTAEEIAAVYAAQS